MSTIVTRSGKGSPLTNTEVDANFTNLNTDKLELSGGTLTGNLSLGDNDKAQFGAGNDLQIYHDGSNSYISEVGAGGLVVQARDAITFEDGTSGDNYLYMQRNSKVELYHAGSPKLTTTATGIDVTGTATMDGLSVSLPSNAGNTLFYGGSQSDRGLEVGVSNADGFDNSAWKISAIAPNSGSTLTLATRDTDRLKIAANGDISFYEDTGTTPKLFWDASAESLGINTSSPDGLLDIEGNFENGKALVLTNTMGTGKVSYLRSHGGNGESLSLYHDGHRMQMWNSDQTIVFETSDTERMRISLSGGLFLGTTSTTPAFSTSTGMHFSPTGESMISGGNNTTLFLNRTSGDGSIMDFRKGGTQVGSIGTYFGDLFIASPSSTDAGLGFGSSKITPVTTTGAPRHNAIDLGASAASFKNLYLKGNAYFSGHISPHGDNAYINMLGSNRIQFLTNGQEAARIDASQNLLVGTTDTDPSNNGAGGDAGHSLSPTGYISSARSGGAVALFNRMDSDGDIAAFRKDGTTVGSIGVASSDLFINGAADHIRLHVNGSERLNINQNSAFYTAADGVGSLGLSNRRFQDLYLSGGVYLGGTGAANKLDDYEEGTFSGTVNGITYDGRYVKVGILVTVFCYYDTSSATGNVIAQLPFAAASEVSTANHGQGITRSTSATHPEGTYAAVYQSTSNAYAYNYSGATLSTPASGNGNFQFSYRTT